MVPRDRDKPGDTEAYVPDPVERGARGAAAPPRPVDTDALPATRAALAPVQLAFPVPAHHAAAFGARYQPDGELGQGGMGLVRLCRDHTVGRTVAIKRLKPEAAASSAAQKRFVQEARIQGQLEHPAVPPVYDFGLDPDGRFFFTMKQVRGETLHDILEHLRGHEASHERAFTQRRLLNAFGNLCLAIDFAHQRGVVHRDLKPANIMLGDFGEVYVLDWGIAKVAGLDDAPADDTRRLAPAVVDQTAADGVFGTLAYMAPEQVARGPEAAGPRSDIYALGAVLYELLTLSPLHDGGGDDRATAIVHREHWLAGARDAARAAGVDVAPELEAIWMRCTEREPAERFASAREVHAALERYLEGQRDEQLRRRVADELARSAAAVVDGAREGAGLGLEARRRAMRAIGRALALDPDSQRAAETMRQLMSSSPDETPAEVEREIAAAAAGHFRWAGRLAGSSFFSIFLYLPLLLWSGVRDPLSLAIVFSLFAVAGCLGFVAMRTGETRTVIGTLLASNLGFAWLSTLLGSLVLVPTLVAVNTVAHAVVMPRKLRPLAVAVGCLAFLGPLGLELAGALAPSYAFSDSAMTILPKAIELDATTTYVLIAIGSAGAIVTGTVGLGHIRDELGAAQRKLFMQTWHLRQFAPAVGQGEAGVDESAGTTAA